jgi:hypothetical protein
VHFLNWVLEQDGEPGGLGLISKVIYQDINNGCAPRFTEISEWKTHFFLEHPKTHKTINTLIDEAVIYYLHNVDDKNS